MADARERIAVVVTTISRGEFLRAYAAAIRQYAGPEHVTLYVVGDLNTPAECKLAAGALAREGIDCRYLDTELQAEVLRPFPELSALIPYRSDARRNVGYLAAFRDRNRVIVTVDDDNFPIDRSPFFAEHGLVGGEVEHVEGISDTGWFNPGALLEAIDRQGRPGRLFPRGFPYARRAENESRLTITKTRGKVGINVGLWLGEPDVDAVSRLEAGYDVHGLRSEPCFLGPRERMPINSQNTALVWHAIPAYYFVLQRRPIGGLAIDRFGDIFSGYFVQLCAEAVGQRVRIGTPLVRQDRNAHNLFRDLSQELPGIVLLESMQELLRQPLTPARSYASAYLELAERIERFSREQTGLFWDDHARAYFAEMARAMRLWVAACVELGGGAEALAC